MGRGKSYNQDNPVVGARLTPYKKALIEEFAARQGVDIQEFLDEYVLKEYFHSRKVKWPATVRGKPGGVRPGAGAPKGNQNARKHPHSPTNGDNTLDDT